MLVFLFFCILLHEMCKRGAFMCYNVLAWQYFEEAATLKKHIKKLKIQYLDTKNGMNEEIKYRISLLYGMYLDLMHTGKYLIKKCEVMKKYED